MANVNKEPRYGYSEEEQVNSGWGAADGLQTVKIELVLSRVL